MSHYPKCECNTIKYEYFRKRYRNGTLHLMRKCPSCGKIAQNPMPQREYDKGWVDSLPIMTNGVMEYPTPQSKADALMLKLQRHIESRNARIEV